MAASVERITPYLLCIVAVYATVRSFFLAATKPLWFDEFCTFIIVRQSHISGMWSALKHGADGQPPAFYLAERFATEFVANENIGFRWLSILGFSCVLLSLFLLIRKQRGGVVALLCAVIPLFTVLYTIYAAEARPYSFVLTCISFALICYQRAPAIRWMILMGFSLALAQSFHYYACLAFSPFILAELCVALVGRHIRWSVWLALVCGFLPLVAFWPLLSTLKVIYGQHFWAKPSFQGAEAAYGWYFNTTFSVGIGLVTVTVLGVLGTMLSQERRATREGFASGSSLQEPILVLAFLSLPFMGFAATTFAHGGMTQYYVLPTILGFPLAVSYIVPRLEGRKAVLFSVLTILFLIVFLGPKETQFWSSHGSKSHFLSPADSVEAFVSTGGHPDLPVVVSDVQDFMVLAHYASPKWKSRFVLLVDPPQELFYVGSDSGDLLLRILRSYFPLQVHEFQEFVAKNPVFLLYSSNGGIGNDWWPGKLLKDGYALHPVAIKPKGDPDFYHRVFLVSRE